MHDFDRGIIKWLPFDALTGFKERIKLLQRRRAKASKPKLSFDQIAVLNDNLNSTYKKNKDITIYYYEKGFIYCYVGKINKIDYIYKKLKVGERWLLASNIMKIESW